MKTKRKQITCNCEAYSFPHRLDSGKCRELYNETPVEPMREKDSIASLGLRSLFEPQKGIAGWQCFAFK